MSKPLRSYFEATRYLGQYIPALVPFLKLTACMSLPRRTQIAVIEWIKEIKPLLDKTDFTKISEIEILDKFLKPLLEKLGYAEWPRDTVTDMAIKRGLAIESESFEENDIDDTEEGPE